MSMSDTAGAQRSETPEERIARLIAEHDLDTVVVGASDLNGVLRARSLPAARFLRDLAAPVSFCDHLVTMDIETEAIERPADLRGWWPDWEGGRGDLHAHPDLTTFRVTPWLPRAGLVLSDYAFRDGAPVSIAPRAVLRRVIERAGRLGLTARVAPELEFYFLKARSPDDPTTAARPLRPIWEDKAYYGAMRQALDEPILRPLRDHLGAAGIKLESWAPESGPGQYELNLSPTPALEAADRGFLFKHAVREISAMQGLVATFMARPLAGVGGSGFHLHMSLVERGGGNVLFDAEAPDRLSTTARHAIAGQLETLPELCALLAPTVNSYKRYLPELAAGDRVGWGIENKSTALRVVNGSPGSCRLELRSAAADANPYLVVAAALAGALHGIERALEPPPEIRGNAYGRAEVATVPASLDEATRAFEGSAVARDLLGDDFVEYYTATRRWEVREFNRAVTDWEIDRYL